MTYKTPTCPTRVAPTFLSILSRWEERLKAVSSDEVGRWSRLEFQIQIPRDAIVWTELEKGIIETKVSLEIMAVAKS